MVENLAVARGLTRPKRSPRKNSSDFYPLSGGLNLIDSPLISEPGQCQNALNYEIGFAGGYKRIGGYRYADGRPIPGLPDYYLLPVALDQVPTVENSTTVFAFRWPTDQEQIRGQTSDASGVIVGHFDNGGYGTNILLNNTDFDESNWDWQPGAFGTEMRVDNENVAGGQGSFFWTGPDATIPSLSLMNATVAFQPAGVEHLSNPLSIGIGDQVYISMLCRMANIEPYSPEFAFHGVRVTIQNLVGDPFNVPSSIPTIDFSVHETAVIAATDHFIQSGVEILSQGVCRIWCLTRAADVADASATIRFQSLTQDDVGSYSANTRWTQEKMFWGGAQCIVITPGEYNPLNYVASRDYTNASGLTRWTTSNVTPNDAGGASWSGGVYPDFCRWTESTDGADTLHFMRALAPAGLNHSPHVPGNTFSFYVQKGHRYRVEFYAKYTAGQRNGIVVQGFGNSFWIWDDTFAPQAGWDLENGVVQTSSAGAIESHTIELVDTDIYKCTMTSAPADHSGMMGLTVYMAAVTSPGVLDYFYQGSGLYLDTTGWRVTSGTDPDPDVLFPIKERVQTDTALRTPSGYLVIAGNTGPQFIEGEEVSVVWRTYKVTATDYNEQYEYYIGIGETLGIAQKNAETDDTYRLKWEAAVEDVAGAWWEGNANSGRVTYDGGAIASGTPQKPPGSGPVRGVILYDGYVYAFRDNEDGTEGRIWKSSGIGWRRVDKHVYKLNFDAGTGAEPKPGDWVQNGTSNEVSRVIYVNTTSGTWGVDAAGEIWIKAKGHASSTVWTSGHKIETSTGELTGGAGTVICNNTTTLGSSEDYERLAPGGKYEFRAGNLYGDKNYKRLYWVNGVDTCYEFIGNVEGFAPIPVAGIADDKPTHLAIHNYHLFLAYPTGSIQVSSDGNPRDFTVILGATEIAVGGKPTGFIEEVSNSLLIFTRNQTWVLNGNTRANFDLDDFNVNAGGHEWSLQRIGLATYFDDRGFTSLRQTSRGDSVDYQEQTQSELIQPLIEDLLRNANVTTSHLIKDENIYRCYFDDGRIVSIGFDQHEVAGHMALQYPFVASCSHSGEAVTGAERIFVGTMDGDVFEVEAGTSFNGDPISAFLRTVLYPSKSPGMFKKYTHIRIDGTFDGQLTMSGKVDFDYGNPELNLGVNLDFSNSEAGGYWDDFVWDNFVWDKTKSGSPQVKLEGEGTNAAIYLSTVSAVDKIHTLRGVTMQWKSRRDDRRT